METIRQNKLDEDGLGLSGVEQALTRINIPLRDTEGQFRNMQDVITDVGKKWSTLDSIEQNNVATQIAGLRQREVFVTLMQNQAMTQKLLTAETDSSGLAVERYGIYLESVDAKAKKMQATLEGVWQKTINSQSIGQVYDIATAVLKLIDDVGGFVPVLEAVGLALVALNSKLLITKALIAFNSISSAISGIQAFFSLIAEGTAIVDVLNVSIGVTEVLTGGIALALAGLVLWFGYASGEAERTRKNIDDLSKQVKDMNSSLIASEKAKESIDDLGKQFDDLKNKINKTNEEQKTFTDIQNRLKDLLPEVNGYYNDQGNFIVNLSTTQETLNGLKQKEIDIEKEQLQLKVMESMKARLDSYKAQTIAIADLSAHLSSLSQNTFDTPLQKGLQPEIITKQNTEENTNQLKEQKLALDQFVNETRIDFTNLNKDQQEQWLKYLDTQGKAGQELAKQLKGMSDEAKKYGPFLPKAPEFNLSDTLKELNNQVKDTGDLMAKAAANSLDFSDVQELIARNPDYIDMISVQNGKIEVNTDALRKLDLQKAKDSLATAQQVLNIDMVNKASEETIKKDQETVDVMQKYVDAIIDGSAYAEQLAAAQKKLEDERKKAAEDALAAEKKEASEKLKLLQDEKKAADDLLKLTIEMIRQEKEAEKDHLNQQMQDYDDLIDKRIEALDSLKAEEDYKRGLKKDVKKASDIRNQIAILSLDNSPEAKAKILKLQQELADQTDKIQGKERDHRLDEEKKALQKEKEDFNKGIKDKIKIIEDYLKQTGKITQDALDLINNHGKETYQKLLEWNRIYGDGIDQTIVDAWNKGKEAIGNYQQLIVDINNQQILIEQLNQIDLNVTQPWKLATDAVQAYIDKLKEIPPSAQYNGSGGGDKKGPLNPGGIIDGSSGGVNIGGGSTTGEYVPPPTHHSGLDSGPVGGLKLKSNEELAKLLKGEIVVTNGQAHNFLNNILPNIAQTTSNVNHMGGTIKIDTLLNVQGNIDKAVLPNIEKMLDKAVEKLNKGNLSRGIKRPTNLNSI